MPTTNSARERSQARIYDPTADKPRMLQWANDEQLEAWTHGPTPLVLSGGYGSGKTFIALLKALFVMDRYPGSRFALGRSVFEELKKTTLATLRKMLPYSAYAYGGKWSIADKTIVLNNGSEFVLVHLDSEDIESIIGGLEINGFVFDQAEEMKEGIFDKLQSRLNRWERVVVPDEVIAEEGYTRKTWPWQNGDESVQLPPPYQILTVNPAGYDHWIYRRFHPNSPDHNEPKLIRQPGGKTAFMSYKEQGYRMITMDSESNKFLPKSTLSLMLSKDESYVNRYVKGEWGFHEGIIHKIDRMSELPGTSETLAWIRNNCRLCRALDHGESSPTAVTWGALDSQGNIFIYREYEVGNKLISFHRKEITELSKGENYMFSVADPKIFSKENRRGEWTTVAAEYADGINGDRNTMLFLERADNNELATRNKLNEYLRVDPKHRHPFTGVYGAPRLYFVSRSVEHSVGCYRLLAELRSQSRTKVGSINGAPLYSDDRSENNEDHLYDCLRYLVAALPALGRMSEAVGNGMTWDEVAKSSDRARRAAPGNGDSTIASRYKMFRHKR